MATRLTTVEYAFAARTTSLAASTRHDFAAITIDIPENSSRVFKSCILEITARDNNSATASRGSVTGITMGVKIGSASFNDASPAVGTLTDTGEQKSYTFHRDVTAAFTVDWSGTSQSVQVGYLFTQTGTNAETQINICAKLIITYEWDDASQVTRQKTVRIPLESQTATGLAASLTEIGTNQVPNLDSFLPEASKSYKSIFFQIEALEYAGNATDNTVSFALDSEGASSFGVLAQACQTIPTFRAFWLRNDMATNAAHAFKASNSQAGSGLINYAILLVVTYTYDHDASSSFLVSQMIPYDDHLTNVERTTAEDQDVLEIPFWVPEPATVSLVQSGVIFYFGQPASSGASGWNFAIGGQTARVYTHTLAGAVAGTACLLQRFDSGAAQGSGHTLVRGKNTLVVKLCVTQTANDVSLNGLIAIINYTCGKASAGDGAHTRTIMIMGGASDASAARRTISSLSFPLPASYFLSGVGLMAFNMCALVATIQNDYALEYLSGEGQADGWARRNNDINGTTAAELAVILQAIGFTGYFHRWAGDPQAARRLNPTTARGMRVQMATVHSSYFFVTYHQITHAVSGTLSGYSGDGSGITVSLHRNSDGELLLTGTTSTGGTFTLNWFDDVDEVFIQSRQDATRCGRSEKGVAG